MSHLCIVRCRRRRCSPIRRFPLADMLGAATNGSAANSEGGGGGGGAEEAAAACEGGGGRGVEMGVEGVAVGGEEQALLAEPGCADPLGTELGEVDDAATVRRLWLQRQLRPSGNGGAWQAEYGLNGSMIAALAARSRTMRGATLCDSAGMQAVHQWL